MHARTRLQARMIQAGSLLLVLAALPAGAATVTLVAGRDGTLVEEPSGSLANGAGPDLFVGRTNQPSESVRRAVVYFDLSAIPKHAVVESARLRLHVLQGGASGAPNVSIHRLLDDWGEGGSVATGGGGAPAEPGDATWIHRVFEPMPPAQPRTSTSLWTSPGGDFARVPSASRIIAGTGEQVWEGPRIAADVQEWVGKPRSNFGWIVVGDETASSTVRKLSSREGLIPDRRPRLEVTYRPR